MGLLVNTTGMDLYFNLFLAPSWAQIINKVVGERLKAKLLLMQQYQHLLQKLFVW